MAKLHVKGIFFDCLLFCLIATLLLLRGTTSRLLWSETVFEFLVLIHLFTLFVSTPWLLFQEKSNVLYCPLFFSANELPLVNILYFHQLPSSLFLALLIGPENWWSEPYTFLLISHCTVFCQSINISLSPLAIVYLLHHQNTFPFFTAQGTDGS